MPWKKFLLNENEIPFTSLVDNKTDYQGNKLSSPQVDLNVKILTEAQDKFKLPKCHQNPSILNIDYDSYLLIYAGLGECQRPGYQIRIEKIFRQEEEINVQVGLYSPANELALEIINLPYDLVKIKKTNLQLTDNINIKFTTDNEKLLAQRNLKLR